MFGVCLLFVAVAVPSSLWLLWLFFVDDDDDDVSQPYIGCFYIGLPTQFAESVPPQFASNKNPPDWRDNTMDRLRQSTSCGYREMQGPRAFSSVMSSLAAVCSGKPIGRPGKKKVVNFKGAPFKGEPGSQLSINKNCNPMQCPNANENGWFQSQQSHNQLSEMRIQVRLDSRHT